MNRVRCGILGAALLVLLPLAAAAQSTNLLIQLQPGGAYRIWHGEGPSVLDDDEVMLLYSLAEPQGSAPVATALGAARARRTAQGVVIDLLDVATDKALLVDHDACGHIKTWHAEGGTPLTEEQATDLVLAAVPGGGRRLALDEQRNAKSFLTDLGVMVAIWRPLKAAR